MSVPAFIDVTEEDQAAELRAYLKSKGAEISEENSEGGLHIDLAQIIEACDVCLREDDKDVESVMNSIVSLLLILEPDKQEALIESLCEKLAKFREGERPSLRLQILSNLFHGMDKNAPVRYTVYCGLIRVATACSAIQYVPTDLDQVRRWISSWNLSIEKKHTLLRLLYEALVDCKKSDAAAKIMVELLGSYTEDNASQARVDAHRCIVRALKDPKTFLLDHLLSLKPVKFLEGELIHDGWETLRVISLLCKQGERLAVELTTRGEKKKKIKLILKAPIVITALFLWCKAIIAKSKIRN